jgi:hypothetical protein
LPSVAIIVRHRLPPSLLYPSERPRGITLVHLSGFLDCFAAKTLTSVAAPCGFDDFHHFFGVLPAGASVCTTRAFAGWRERGLPRAHFFPAQPGSFARALAADTSQAPAGAIFVARARAALAFAFLRSLCV